MSKIYDNYRYFSQTEIRLRTLYKVLGSPRKITNEIYRTNLFIRNEPLQTSMISIGSSLQGGPMKVIEIRWLYEVQNRWRWWCLVEAYVLQQTFFGCNEEVIFLGFRHLFSLKSIFIHSGTSFLMFFYCLVLTSINRSGKR